MTDNDISHKYCRPEDLLHMDMWPLPEALVFIFEEDDPVAYETCAQSGQRIIRSVPLLTMVYGDVAIGALTIVNSGGKEFVNPYHLTDFACRHGLRVKEMFDDHADLIRSREYTKQWRQHQKLHSSGDQEKALAEVMGTRFEPQPAEHAKVQAEAKNATPISEYPGRTGVEDEDVGQEHESSGETPVCVEGMPDPNAIDHVLDRTHLLILEELHPDVFTSSKRIHQRAQKRKHVASHPLIKRKVKQLKEMGLVNTCPRGAKLSSEGVRVTARWTNSKDRPPSRM